MNSVQTTAEASGPPTYSKIGSYPLFVTVGLASSDILSEWHNQAWVVSLVLLLFLLASSGFAAFISCARKREYKAHQELRASERKLTDILEQVDACIYLKDLQERYLYANRSVCELFGTGLEEIVGQSNERFFDADTCAAIHRTDRQVLDQGKTVKTEDADFNFKNGAPATFLSVKLPLRDTSGQIYALCGISTDITERKQAERTLAASEERFRMLFEKSSDALFITHPDGTIESANSPACRMFGMTVEEFRQAGRAAIVDKDDPRFPAALDTRARTGEYNGELNFVRKSGQVFPADIASSIFMDSSGDKRAVVRICDITERKQAEVALQKKTDEMEQFTYSVSHDLRSPLVTVKTFLGYLEQDLAAADSSRTAEDLQYIRGAADKMEVMLGELLEMSRIGRVTSEAQSVSFRHLAEEALVNVAGQVAELKVLAQIADVEIMLYGDRQRLAQIWQNLLENAVKYLGDQGSPLIKLGAERQGQDVVFSVRDNGIGVAPEDHEKVFGLFTKLDTHSSGVGLGLAMVRRIVELYNGRIWVESAGVGQGACFCFTLPGALEEKR